ncbi:BatD family protein [uncultured Bacteroides sp.]|uniref:BatD family protein n=1 Tax=uncultured Bacteroides sp. TaxID=162156 RepID=UPI002585884D|nr:BatD family protein [uncultured Bacteroides sp.]
MTRKTLVGGRFLYFLLSLLFSYSVVGADVSQSGTSGKINDRKVQCLKGYVSEVVYPDGTLTKFNEEGTLVRSKHKQFSYEENYKYVLERGVITAFEVECSGNIRREISCDTEKEVEKYTFDEEGRMVEHLIGSYPARKYQYFFQGTETLPYKKVYCCDTIPSGTLTYYYQYLKKDQEGNWLQRGVKISGGSSPAVNRVYVDTRRLKYYAIPTDVISSIKGDVPNINSYEQKFLNNNNSGIQKAYKQGETNFEIISPERVEVGEEFEIAFVMKQKPRDIHISKSKQFEFLHYDYRTNTAVVKGDTVKSCGLVLKLKAKQKGILTLPSLKVRFGSELNISPSREIIVSDAQVVPTLKDDNPAVTLSATLSKDTIHLGESAILSLRICTSCFRVTSVHLSKPDIASCMIQEIPMDSVIWKNIPFEKGSYDVGEYKKFKLTPTQAGTIEIFPFGCDCELSRFTFPNAGLLKNVATSSTLLGAVATTVTTIVAVKPKIEKRNESVHTESLRLYILP